MFEDATLSRPVKTGCAGKGTQMLLLHSYRSSYHLIPTTLERIAHEIGGELRGASASPVPVSSQTIDRICTDSRGAAPGALFVALKGQQTDGHRFLADAFRSGATVSLFKKKKLAKDRASVSAFDPGGPIFLFRDPLRAL